MMKNKTTEGIEVGGGGAVVKGYRRQGNVTWETVCMQQF